MKKQGNPMKSAAVTEKAIAGVNAVSPVFAERRVGFPGCKNFVLYYTNSPWNAAGDAFYFFSVSNDDCQPALCMHWVATGETEKCYDLEPFSQSPVSALFSSVLLPRRELMILYGVTALAVTDLATHAQELKIVLAGDCVLHGPLCISPDERYLCYGVSARNEPTDTDIRVHDTLDPAWPMVFHKTVSMNANHFQFFPNGADILFAHEGATEQIPDRLQCLNWRSGQVRCLYRHLHDVAGRQIECIGHEHIAGDKVVAVRYPVSQMDFGLILADPQTSVCELIDRGDYWHCASDRSGTRIVMDTMWWGNSRRQTPNVIDIVLFDAVAQKRHVLKTFQADPGGLGIFHPHPHFDDTGKMVLYVVRPEGTDECWLELLQLN
ncbi:MAG: hypothetical protein WC340_16810 [Kiritimatiellia bacterium]